MRLIVHMGLHKTATTYLQHLLNDHSDALAERGVYYQKQAGYPAHHHDAWRILRGDHSPLSNMVAAARMRNCHTLILSSEDLEGLIFQPQAVAAFESAAAAAGAEAMEWHMCLRDTGEYFASLHAQLQHHVYADAIELFYEVMRDGMVFIPDPSPGQEATPFWCFCFDHLRYISGFAQATAHPVVVHDYRDDLPFPAWRMLEALDVLDLFKAMPEANRANRRMAPAAVEDGYVRRVQAVIQSQQARTALLPLLEQQIRASASSVRELAPVVAEQFSESTAAALQHFGCAERPHHSQIVQ